MPDYDISQAFARIEDELISSMFRNFSRHRAEETLEGFNWEMWQVRQLQALEEYREANKRRFTKEFSDLNSRIDEFIRQARADGAAEQEIAILEAIKKGYTPRNAFNGTAELAADFIKLNDRKMDALINATTNDLERAEYAMLRMADDQYRKIIFDAQVYAASGAGTYEKAVDMAARDFLRAGINCIEYSNGARHTIQDYVSMVMATTGKRAYLAGEGEMRKRWGESLVIMNKRGNPCPLCAPFVGKVLVDDVWSGGKPDGIHLLMSTAIAKGLYHPRCKDGHTTYFEGISDKGEPYTESERRELIEQYNAEQKRNYAKNLAEKFGRIEMYSLDEGNKKVYAARAEKWAEIAGESVDKSGGSGIIKNIELPAEIETIRSMSVETRKAVSDAIERIQGEYNVKLDSVITMDLGEEFGRVPFQYRYFIENGELNHTLVINSGYYFNDSHKAFQERILRNYNNRVLASKSVEDLIAHEMAHIMTFQSATTEGAWLLENKKLSKHCIPGVSAYADASGDGAETIAEAFVRMRNGETIPPKARDLVFEYVERWRK